MHYAKILLGLVTLMALGSESHAQFSHAVADFSRPYVYAVKNDVTDSLVFIDTESEQITRTIPIGSNVTDMTIHYGEGRLYVTNWQSPVTRVVDLETQTELDPLALGSDVYKINAGRTGRIYYEEEDQWINIKIINTATGAEMGSIHVREGDGEISPTGAYYYHCDNNISNAHITKYNISTDQATEVAESNVHGYGSRNLVLSGDGSRLFWRGYVYDPDLNELGYLGSEIYETTLHGDLAFGSIDVFNTHTGDVIYTLPWPTSILAVSGDQTKVFLFRDGDDSFEVIPMSDIADIPGPGLNPVPDDGTTIVLPLDELGWDINPLAIGYDVYFGSDSTAVANAESGSPEYLGRVTENRIDLSASLDLGARYFWRVDMVGFSEIVTGEVWSFTVAPIVVAPSAVAIAGVTGASPLPVRLILTADGGSEPWSLSESSPWFEVDRTSGSTPDTVEVSFDTVGMTAGLYADTLSFTSGEYAFEVPVALELFEMALTQMEADFSRPYIYALHRGEGGLNDAFLLFINTETEIIERVLPIGTNPTDMTVHYGEGRLYVTNWRGGFTRVVDLETQTELDPMELGPDVYKINAGRPGRIYYEEEDQWIDIKIINTATGAEMGSIHVREGDGEVSPTGTYYYHCDNNISNAHITKYDISTDQGTMVATSTEHPYGSRNLVLSGDGSRLFWRGYVYDSNLYELANMGAEIYETTFGGEIAFGASQAFNSTTGDVLSLLPHASEVMAVSGDQKKLFLWDADGGQLVIIPMSEVAGTPSEDQTPVPAHGETIIRPLASLSWTLDPAALSYDVFFGDDEDAVGTADIDSDEYLGSVAGEPTIALDRALDLGATYYWRVDRVGFLETTVGEVWFFHVAPIEVDPATLELSALVEWTPPPVTLELEADGESVVWTVTEDIPWLTVSPMGGETPDTLIITLETETLPVGVHLDTLGFASGDQEFGVPVDLSVFEMALTQMIADPDRPYIYALQADLDQDASGSGASRRRGNAALLFVNTQTEVVERVIPAGTNATDMTIHLPENRLYIANHGQETTRVVDLETQSASPALHLGPNVYHIDAGRANRAYYQEGSVDGYTTVNLMVVATNTSAEVGSLSVRPGEGAIDPTFQYYYHYPREGSRYLRKYTIVPDRPTQVDAIYTGSQGHWEALVLSGDGERVFCAGRVYNSSLDELLDLAAEIYATTHDGLIAVSASQVFDGETGDLIHDLDFATRVVAISGDQRKLVRFDPDSQELEFFMIDDIVPVLLESFVAERRGAHVVLRWTALGLGTDVAFNVYRKTEVGDLPKRISDEPLNQRRHYEFVDKEQLGGELTYLLNAVDPSGETWFGPVTVTVVPYVYALAPNYPNPFNPHTNIRFELPETRRVRLYVFDVGGRVVRTLVADERPPGAHTVQWDGRDNGGRAVASGLYFYRMEAGDFVRTRQMVLLK